MSNKCGAVGKFRVLLTQVLELLVQFHDWILVAEIMLDWLWLKALCSKTIPYDLKPSKWKIGKLTSKMCL